MGWCVLIIHNKSGRGDGHARTYLEHLEGPAPDGADGLDGGDAVVGDQHLWGGREWGAGRVGIDLLFVISRRSIIID